MRERLVPRARSRLSLPGVTGDEPSTEELRRRQCDRERAEREQLADSDTDAEADSHRRRAEKAGYLRRKLEEREQAERGGVEQAERGGVEQAERGGADDPTPPPAA
jgi:hypothetical protein